MDVGVVGKKTFLGSVEKVCAVVDASLLAGGATENLGLPGVTVYIVSFELRKLST
jgi:hypothetical protein